MKDTRSRRERLTELTIRYPRGAGRHRCWIWAGHKNPEGYGTLWFEGHHRKAHRLAYEEFIGEIPEGLVIDHLCRQRACVKPGHLRAVTVNLNSRRANGGRDYSKMKKPLGRTTHCKQGHEYNEKNTYIWRGHSGRRCRMCLLGYQKAFRKRQKERMRTV